MFARDKAVNFNPHGFLGRVRVFKKQRVPTIVISREAYTKMWLYVDIAPEEVGWVGTSKQLPNGDFSIEKVWLLKQHVTGVETTLTLDGWADMATELLSRDEEGLEDWDNLRFWGHSHVRMGTSPSGRDQKSMEELEESQHPWFIRGIFNKLGRIEFTVYLYDKGIVFEDAPWTVEALPPITATTQIEPSDERSEHSPKQLMLDGEDKKSDHPKLDIQVMDEEKSAEEQAKPSLQTRKFAPAKTKANPLYQPDLTEDLRSEVKAEFDVKVKSRWSSYTSSDPTWNILDEEEHFRALQSALESAPAAAPVAALAVESAQTPVAPVITTESVLAIASLPAASAKSSPSKASRVPKKGLWVKLSELIDLLQNPHK